MDTDGHWINCDYIKILINTFWPWALFFKGSHKTHSDKEHSSCFHFTMKCFGVEETIWFFSCLLKQALKRWDAPSDALQAASPTAPGTAPAVRIRYRCFRGGCTEKKPRVHFDHETHTMKKEKTSLYLSLRSLKLTTFKEILLLERNSNRNYILQNDGYNNLKTLE